MYRLPKPVNKMTEEELFHEIDRLTDELVYNCQTIEKAKAIDFILKRMIERLEALTK